MINVRCFIMKIDHLYKRFVIDEQRKHEYEKNLMINLIIYLTVSHVLAVLFDRIQIRMGTSFFRFVFS